MIFNSVKILICFIENTALITNMDTGKSDYLIQEEPS